MGLNIELRPQVAADAGSIRRASDSGEEPSWARHRVCGAGCWRSAPVLGLSGCGYNDFQRLDEQVKASWSEVLNQYQRRADLIPNIVNTVKGEASFEQETLTKVVEARAKATSIQVTPETLNNPEAFNKFQQAQGELSSALSRLIAVSENYPNLKANQGFQDLRVQLEGTENRITVARNRYIKAVADYNVLARQFPTNLTAMLFSYSVKPSFTVENEAQISSRPPSTSTSPRLRRRSEAGAASGAASDGTIDERHRLASGVAAPRQASVAGRVRLWHSCARSRWRRSWRRFPPLQGRVIDDTATLQPAQRQAMEQHLANVERELGSQIVVLIVPTTLPEGHRRLRAARGRPVEDRPPRRRRRPVDRGGQERSQGAHRGRQGARRRGARPGGAPDHHRDHHPAFKRNDYAGGLNAAIDRIAARIKPEGLPAPDARTRPTLTFGQRVRLEQPGDVLLRRRADRRRGAVGHLRPQARRVGHRRRCRRARLVARRQLADRRRRGAWSRC